MRTLVEQARERLLSAKDTVCLQRARLVTEAYRRHESDPPALRRARAFAHVLAHMDLDVDSNPVFAGNTSSRPRGWMLIPEHGFGVNRQIALENDGLDSILDGRIPDDMREYWAGNDIPRSAGGTAGVGHLAVDMERVVHEGLEAIITETNGYPDDPDPERRNYRKAMATALRAVVDWAHRYVRAAETAARSASDPIVRAAHLRVARACRQVPGRPARDLFEALQAMVLTHLAVAIEGHGLSISIGLPDRVLAPFIGDGFDPEATTELIAAWLLKIASNSYQGRGSKTQAITVGGLDHRGRDQCNALTFCFLDAFDRVRVGDPHLFLRWHERMDEGVKRRAVEMLASGASVPLLVNDEQTARGFVQVGADEEDAWDYCVIGCNELGIPGRCMQSAVPFGGLIEHIELLNCMLLDHSDPDEICNMPVLLACLEETLSRQVIESRRRSEARWVNMSARVPTPFTSALMQGCAERGEDLLTGMRYRFAGVYERGLTNAVNALAAIEKVVFEEHRLTMSELVEAMRGDFEDEHVRRMLRQAPKWGNDDDRVDRWALRLVEMRERALDMADERFGGRTHMVCHVVRSLHHIHGQRIAASPDGRRAWTPVAESIGAEVGTALGGPTALLNSVLKLDAARYFRGGYNLNLTLPKSSALPQVLRPLIEAFFAGGGQELQVNCLDVDTLRAARQDPERYHDLVVRVAGFNARFVDLSAVEQEEIIRRAELAVLDQPLGCV